MRDSAYAEPAFEPCSLPKELAALAYEVLADDTLERRGDRSRNTPLLAPRLRDDETRDGGPDGSSACALYMDWRSEVLLTLLKISDLLFVCRIPVA